MDRRDASRVVSEGLRAAHLRAVRVSACAGMGAVLLLAGCSTRSDISRAASTPLRPLHREDLLWLERTSFGLDTGSVADYRRLGREKFLDRQLHPAQLMLPAPIAAQIAALEITREGPAQSIAAVNAQYKVINAMPDGSEKEQARKVLNDHGNKLAYEAIRRDLLRAVYSPAQLQEEMTWFWLNHFSVFQYKANLRWLVGDYEERAIRPHVFEHFKDLVMATLQHPAMLQYLDNNQNAAGHINENYARELLELHTLGVGGGYSQQDVQELARVLTGVGINVGDAPRLKPEWQRLYLRSGAFEFNPARHDFGAKTILGHPIRGQGFGEVEEAVKMIVSQPACARFISRELAIYFVADNPPPILVERLAQTFMRTDGDIAAVLHTLFMSPELGSSFGAKFKDPMRFVVSAVRFAYDGKLISNTHPMLNWLNGLGEAPYGRQTPDGYPMTELSWASAGQMSRRFEIARIIGMGNAALFDPEDGSAASTAGFPQLANRLYFEALEPSLATRTKAALDRANSQQEWNTFLLSSPDFNYE
ncbi:MAG: DUF1800 domain-containing protein [Pseudomonadota bacterium]|nr:DUF1800 domain-containing protein [Pseudomonadota bacterium]